MSKEDARNEAERIYDLNRPKIHYCATDIAMCTRLTSDEAEKIMYDNLVGCIASMLYEYGDEWRGNDGND